ncbi:galactose-1-epimerase [Photobacterium leiognathi]|uniref:galactose-1-epimerase n=1 Tax=Photobacterium leiognathi TaxID=553611 RepID=UPI002980F2DF|nr:galactose-1-epimerase [Photobacterium leiognathi]
MQSPLMHAMTRQLAHDGKPANIIELTNSHGMRIVLMDIGATWLSCCLPLNDSEQREVLLGVDNLADFYAQQSYMGVTVGRYANRIANGRFSIDGKAYQVSTNQNGNCLHGGKNGFNQRRWLIVEQSQDSVLFSLVSEDGDQGFPGTLNVTVRYTLTDSNEATIHYLADSDKTTPVNLTNHGYFNLQGATWDGNSRSHTVRINANYYLPTNSLGIPLDKPQPVENTSFDFRTSKTLSKDLLADKQQQQAKGYDHSFVLNPARKPDEIIAEVISPDSKVTMTVKTNKPAVQLYGGNWLAGTPARDGKQYQDYAGLALETQFLPDSPNHPEWEQPSCYLSPQKQYNYKTTYQFSY